MDNLIYDRTQVDVDRAIELNDKYNRGTITTEEMAEWDNGLKGAYNYTDLNRIETWCEYIAIQLNSYNYNVNITTKTDWDSEDFPIKVELKRIRDNVETLKNAFYSLTSVPDSLEKMTYKKANDLEKVLNELNMYINNMQFGFLYSGTFYSGESEGLLV